MWLFLLENVPFFNGIKHQSYALRYLFVRTLSLSLFLYLLSFLYKFIHTPWQPELIYKPYICCRYKPYIMCPSAWVATTPLWWQLGGYMLNKMDGMLKTLVKVNYLPNYNAGHNVLELYNILVPIRFTTSKRTLDI